MASTLVALSQRCACMPHLKRIHARLIRHRRGLPRGTATLILAKLLRFAAVSPRGDIRYATLIFSYHQHDCDSSSAFFYNTLVRGHANTSDPSIALSLFNSMRRRSVPPDPFSFTFLLKARSRCLPSSSSSSSYVLVGAGADIHALAFKFGCLGAHSAHAHVHNALIHLYASAASPAASPAAAQQVFDELPVPDVVSWSALLTAYLRARDLDAARRVFNMMPERDVVAWTAMISGYAQARRPREALQLFQAMPMPPDEVTMVGVISACTAVGDPEAGENVHRYVDERGFGWMVSIRNALLDMYAKCGDLDRARRMFDMTQSKSLITWNSMISAYAAHGDADAATSLFHGMAKGGVRPDGATFLAVLTACTHKGWVDKGRRLFEAMSEHGVEAGVEHYGCMVDMLGRAGLLEEARQLIEGMPVPSNDVVWGALLGACRIHGDIEMAEQAVTRLMALKPDEGGYYILLSEIYAASGRQAEAMDIRRAMKQRGARKTPGCSSSWAVA